MTAYLKYCEAARAPSAIAQGDFLLDYHRYLALMIQVFRYLTREMRCV